MILNVKPVISKAYDCLQTVLATLSEYYDKEYQMIALGRWGFDYTPINGGAMKIGEKLISYSQREIHAAADFHGLSFEIYKQFQEEEEELFLKFLEKKNPVIIYSDLYFCFWNQAYKKYHNPHFYLVIGFNEKNGNYICLDPYIQQLQIECSYQEIYKGMSDYRTLAAKSIAVKRNDYFSELKKDTDYYYETGTFDNVNCFADDIKNKMDIDKEFEGCDSGLFAVPILDNIRIIATNRMGYYEMLKYISVKWELCMDKVIDSAHFCTEEWMGIRMMLMKMFLSSNNRNHQANKISDRIRWVNQRECKLMSEIGIISEKNQEKLPAVN